MAVTLNIFDSKATSEGPETNETDRNSMGGTEIMKYGLHNRLDKDLLSNFQIICSRVREINPNKKIIYWLHDLPGDPESEHLKNQGWKRFDKLVFVSNWQLENYSKHYGIPYSKCVVLQNAIEPIGTHDKDFTGRIKLMYHSTPHRGLDLLVAVFQKLCEMFDNIELDVFSSFAIYGWKERDEPFKKVFDVCKSHPKINYFGSVSNEEIRQALQRNHIWAYPSIWQETSCMCLMEAMSAGLYCVHPNLAALPETAANWTHMYQWDEDPPRHANKFAANLIQAIKIVNTEQAQHRIQMTKTYADSFYSWEIRKHQWEQMLKGVLNESK